MNVDVELSELAFLKTTCWRPFAFLFCFLNLLKIKSTNAISVCVWVCVRAGWILKVGLDVLLCTKLSKDTTCNVCAAFHAGIPLIIFHPGRMQMQRKTNVKSIKSFIKHFQVSATPVCLSVTSTVAFSPLCHIVSCITTGASTWMGTALNKASRDGWCGLRALSHHHSNMQTELQHSSFN